METGIIAIVIAIVTAAATIYQQRVAREPHRLNEVYNGLRLLGSLAEMSGKPDQASELTQMADAIFEGRRLTEFPLAKPDKSPEWLASKVFSAASGHNLDAIHVYGKNKAECHSALMKLGGRLQRRK